MFLSEMKIYRSTKHTFKVIVLLAVLLIFIIYALYRYHVSRQEFESLERLKPLLEADLARAKNPVVAAFQRKNSGSKEGLRYVETKELKIRPEDTAAEAEDIFFKYLETKQVICGNDVRLGNQHDGGWNVCMSPPFKLGKPCLVYSFGIGGDWRFEDDLYDYYSCKVLAFDPSMGLKPHNRTELMIFKPIGLGTRFDITPNGWKLKSFRTLLTDEGHLKSTIDCLKFDIEYMEWDVLKSLTRDNILQNVKQIVFEIHLQKPPIMDRGMKKTNFVEKLEILKGLEEVGFKKFNYRMNPHCLYVSGYTGKSRSKCYDLHYLNMDFVEMKHFDKPKDKNIL